MQQAIHIFLKDLRRLWIQIVLLMAALVFFAARDIQVGAIVNGFDLGTPAIEFVAGAFVWLLIARAVHEESLAGENQFWVTRPYERGQLLMAKVLLLAAAVILPFFATDCVILGVQSLSVTENLGGLLLRQLLTATWLILPPFAIASLTRSITEDILAWIGCGAIAITYFNPKGAFAQSNEKYLLAVSVVLMVVVLWRQYLRRGLVASRAIMAAAVLIPVFSFPESAAVAIENMRNDPAASAISLSVKPDEPLTRYPGVSVEARQDGPGTRLRRCSAMPVKVTGSQPDWRVEILHERDTFTTDDGKSVTAEKTTYSTNRLWDMQVIYLCPPDSKLPQMAAAKKISVHTSLILAVVTDEKTLEFHVQGGAFDVPGVGRCQLHSSLPGETFALFCAAPIWAPATGNVGLAENRMLAVGLSNAYIEYPFIPMGMLPGMSPVYKWVTLVMDHQIRQALGTGGATIEFTPEKRIAVIRREIDVNGVQFPE